MTKEFYTVKNGIATNKENYDSIFEEEEDEFLEDCEEIDVDALFNGGGDDRDDYNKVPKWNFITAFDEVLQASRHNEGRVEHGKRGRCAVAFLKRKLKMTQMQIIVLAMLIDNGQAMTWQEMARFLGMSRITMMTYTDEIEALVEKHRWLQHTWTHRHGGRNESFKLVFGVIKAIRHNEVFVPENLSGLTEQVFAERVTQRIEESRHDMDRTFEEDEKWLMYLMEQNPQLPLAKEARQTGNDIHNKCLLLLFVADYMHYAGMNNEGLNMSDIDNIFPSDWQWPK